MGLNGEGSASDGGTTRWSAPAIDRRYFDVRPALFYRDLIVPGAAFAIAFSYLLRAEGWAFATAFPIAVVSLHRAAILVHDICHQYDNPRLKFFIWVWDLTIGAITANSSRSRAGQVTPTLRVKPFSAYTT